MMKKYIEWIIVPFPNFYFRKCSIYPYKNKNFLGFWNHKESDYIKGKSESAVFCYNILYFSRYTIIFINKNKKKQNFLYYVLTIHKIYVINNTMMELFISVFKVFLYI